MTNTQHSSVLLVDDNPSDVILMQHALRDMEWTEGMAVVADGEEAIKYLSAEGEYHDRPIPSLVLLDLNLPKVEGREVLRYIKATNQLKRVPVVILSGSKSRADIEEVYDLNANCYIVKPSGLDQLRALGKALNDFWFGVAKLPYGC